MACGCAERWLSRARSWKICGLRRSRGGTNGTASRIRALLDLLPPDKASTETGFALRKKRGVLRAFFLRNPRDSVREGPHISMSAAIVGDAHILHATPGR